MRFFYCFFCSFLILISLPETAAKSISLLGTRQPTGAAEHTTREAKVTHFISAVWRHPVSIPTVNLHNTRSLYGCPCSVAIFCTLQAKIFVLYHMHTHYPLPPPVFQPPAITHTINKACKAVWFSSSNLCQLPRFVRSEIWPKVFQMPNPESKSREA